MARVTSEGIVLNLNKTFEENAASLGFDPSFGIQELYQMELRSGFSYSTYPRTKGGMRGGYTGNQCHEMATKKIMAAIGVVSGVTIYGASYMAYIANLCNPGSLSTAIGTLTGTCGMLASEWPKYFAWATTFLAGAGLAGVALGDVFIPNAVITRVANGIYGCNPPDGNKNSKEPGVPKKPTETHGGKRKNKKTRKGKSKGRKSTTRRH